jgi:hypothetical protein
MYRPTLLAVWAAVMVPALLMMARGSLWPAILAYHLYCVGVPLAFRCFSREAGLIRSDARRCFESLERALESAA